MNIFCLVVSLFSGFPLLSCLALPAPPTNVRVSEITATSVRLTWSYSEPEDLQYYVIQFKPKNSKFSEITGIVTMYYSVRI
ncbi:hypothetical protein NQ317_008059 [Molorchus minor]|uniref:Fibronectin type-III domain-containing protein n=1 Tax=Molorchus minor TaxID=1323400 RepID=A0ABQ9IT44_9CUCU|nr:hypothetical protein NQ317_008059 [Molorchus minor]